MMSNQDIRWEQRFTNFKKALVKLSEVAETRSITELSELEVEGLIQRFEYTYELVWKTLQDFLRSKGYVDIAGPNPVLNQAFQDGYIVDAEGWKRLKKARELTSHMYDNEVAQEIAEEVATAYYPLFKQLAERLEQNRYGFQTSLF